MVMMFLAIVTVTVLLHEGHAYSQGAQSGPMSIMESYCRTLRPNHGVLPQHSPAPFTISAEQPSGGYRPGVRVKVTLKGINKKKFKGFFITGDPLDGQRLEGRFQNSGANEKPTEYCGQLGATHTGPNLKDTVVVFWNPPANFTHGSVQFTASVVENKNIFWTGIKSNPITADPTTKERQNQQKCVIANYFSVDNRSQLATYDYLVKFTVHMQQNANNMMRMFQQQLGAAGGNRAGANTDISSLLGSLFPANMRG